MFLSAGPRFLWEPENSISGTLPITIHNLLYTLDSKRSSLFHAIWCIRVHDFGQTCSDFTPENICDNLGIVCSVYSLSLFK